MANRLWICCVVMIASLCQLCKGDLTVSLIEVDAGGTIVSFAPLTVTNPRTINLVPGLFYHIQCKSASGFDGLDDQIWLNGSGDPVTVISDLGMQPATGNQALYARLTTPGNLNEWSLVLQVFSENMLGTYLCQGREGANASITIGMRNPTLIAWNTDLILNEGVQERRALTVFFSAIPSAMNSELTWYFNFEPASSPFSISENELRLPANVNDAVDGQYTCVLNTTAGRDVANFTITVLTQPSLSLNPSEDQDIEQGSSITINCTDTQGNPPPSFTWTRDDIVLESVGRVSVTASVANRYSVLMITSLEPEDTGKYECMAVNPLDPNIKTATSLDIRVLYSPILDKVSPSSLSPIENETVTLRATLVGADPPPEDYTWRFDNQPLLPSQKYSISEVNLTVSMVKAVDSGTYTVEASNKIGTGNAVQFEVNVLVPPILIHATPDITYATPGSLRTIQFRVYNDPNPAILPSSITWWFTGQLLNTTGEKYTSSFSGSNGALTIKDIEIADAGFYVANVSHSTGSRTLSFEAIVKNPPLALTNLTVTLLSECTARVSWDDPPTPDAITATADYIIIEVQISGSSQWTLGTTDSVSVSERSTEVFLPGSVADGVYHFRTYSENKEFGRGEDSPPLSSITAYPTSGFPTLMSLSASPVTDSNSILVSWSVPSTACFQFTAFEAKCYPMDGSGQEATAGGGELSVVVSQLLPDTYYDCELTITLSDREGNEIGYQPVSETVTGFTYPDAPAAPDQPTNEPPGVNTIKVEFDIPDDSADISHYWVVVVRLDSLEAPTSHPDELYPAGFNFSNAAEVNSDSGKDNTPLPYIAAELDAVGFNADPTFIIGNGEPMNVELVPNTYYTCFLRAFPRTLAQVFGNSRRQANSGRQYSVFSSSTFLLVARTASDNPPPTGGSSSSSSLGLTVGIAVPILVIIIALILIVAIVIVIMKYGSSHRRGKESITASVDMDGHSSSFETPDLPDTDTPDLAKRQSAIEMKAMEDRKPHKLIPSPPILVDQFSAHVEEFDAKRQLLFQEEFDWITAKSPWYPSEASNDLRNDEKNRYSNITAFDHTRVKLTPVEGMEYSDYINANFISGCNRTDQYIASQGPLEQTVCDFWRMVWEQNTVTIVMLTNLVEVGKIKCHQYWPSTGSKAYGDLVVTLDSSVVLSDYTIRKMIVQSLSTDQSRTVLQFHYTKWPDYGTPNVAAPLLNFLRAVRTSNVSKAGPIIIHCSAGVGRSGTVITIDHVLQSVESGVVDIRGFVSEMRKQRNYMVQTEHTHDSDQLSIKAQLQLCFNAQQELQQYTFIHYAVLEAITYGDTSFRVSHFSDTYQHLQEVNPDSGKTLLQEEFDRLGTVRTMVKKSSFVETVKPKGGNGRHRKFFPIPEEENGGASYNAHYVDSYHQSNLFIVANGPDEDSVTEFWQMIWDEQCANIVMLTPNDEEYYTYWPAMGDLAQHGNIIVKVQEETAEHLYTIRTIKLTHAKDGISHLVQQYQFLGWTTQYLPPVPTFVNFVCEILKTVDSVETNQRLLLHDTVSLDPCGVFCSLCYCIERLGVESLVDVFQAVQKIQLQRPNMVGSMLHYAFIYDCVSEFIRTNLETQV